MSDLFYSRVNLLRVHECRVVLGKFAYVNHAAFVNRVFMYLDVGVCPVRVLRWRVKFALWGVFGASLRRNSLKIKGVLISQVFKASGFENLLSFCLFTLLITLPVSVLTFSVILRVCAVSKCCTN